MVHNTKKRSASESEAAVKVKEEFVSKKKKSANGTVQNGQANKDVKKEVLPKVKVEQKPGGEKDKKSRVAYREKRKQARAGKQVRGVKPDVSVEDIKKKVEEIESRGNLSKSAKRKLASLKKLLQVKEGTFKPKPQVVKKQAGEGKKEKQVAAPNKKQAQNTVEQKKKVPEKVQAKPTKDSKKKDVKQGNLLLAKQTKQSDDEDDDEDEEEEDTDVDDESGEDEEGSDVEDEEGDDDDDEDDDDDDDEDEEEEEEEEEEDDEEEDEAEEVKTTVVQSPSKQTAEQGGKKKRYVLFVGNLPFNVTVEEIKKHFLTKVSQVVHVRIPKTKEDAPRGFAYVELSNHTDYEKAISLNNSYVNGRRINVQYSGSNKKVTVAKNQKLKALQKAGKLGGGQKTNFGKNTGWKGGKPNAQKTKT